MSRIPGIRQTHRLKTLPDYWYAVADGRKRFEVRKNDREFQEGDTLHLLLASQTPGRPQAVLECVVTYVLTGGKFGVDPEYVILGIGEVRLK